MIPDAASLAGHYSEIFSPYVRNTILGSKAGDFICRYDEGLGYKAGVIWVATDDNKFSLQTVNSSDPHASAVSPALVYTCETKTHRIAVQDLKNGKYRYRSWNKPRTPQDTPDVDLFNGVKHFEGTGVCSYAVYSFTKGNFTYEVDNGMGCGDGSEPKTATGSLNVTIDGKSVTHAWCY